MIHNHPRSNNHPSNPQQPIHSPRLAPVRHTLKQTQLCGWFPLLSLIYSQVMPGRCGAPEYMEARRWTGTSWCNPVVSWSITTIYWFDKSTIINQLHQRTGVPPWKSPLIATPSNTAARCLHRAASLPPRASFDAPGRQINDHPRLAKFGSTCDKRS